MIRASLFGLCCLTTLVGCTTQEWKTAYTPVDAAQANSWTVRAVEVSVPETLTTSELNTVEPDFDVVWHGEPLGDRRAQVDAIMTEGIQRGAAGLRGRTPVTISATVKQFHAITPEAERVLARIDNAGVDDIAYTIQVFDASGTALTEPQTIEATIPATVAANRPEIVNHIAAVTQSWLGRGPDLNTSFTRIGR